MDTYKGGTTANSCSTMHKLASSEIGAQNFSFDMLIEEFPEEYPYDDEYPEENESEDQNG